MPSNRDTSGHIRPRRLWRLDDGPRKGRWARRHLPAGRASHLGSANFGPGQAQARLSTGAAGGAKAHPQDPTRSLSPCPHPPGHAPPGHLKWPSGPPSPRPGEVRRACRSIRTWPRSPWLPSRRDSGPMPIGGFRCDLQQLSTRQDPCSSRSRSIEGTVRKRQEPPFHLNEKFRRPQLNAESSFCFVVGTLALQQGTPAHCRTVPDSRRTN
jgi:hypothetical protein